MVVATDYPFLDILWTMLVFFAWVIWFWILVMVLSDAYRRHDLSGWGKAGWTVLVIVLPFVGVLAYLIAHGDGMARRRDRDVRDESSMETIAKGKDLLDRGAISESEIDQIKRRTLA